MFLACLFCFSSIFKSGGMLVTLLLKSILFYQPKGALRLIRAWFVHKILTPISPKGHSSVSRYAFHLLNIVNQHKATSAYANKYLTAKIIKGLVKSILVLILACSVLILIVQIYHVFLYCETCLNQTLIKPHIFWNPFMPITIHLNLHVCKPKHYWP